MKQWFRPAVLALILLAPVGVRAEVVYVSDGINLGVHQDAALSSTIITLLPAGTALEILEQKNGMVKVRLGNGTQGWVDSRYLSKNVSPAQTANALEAELTQTASELANARELAAELEYQLNREKERAKIMEADLLKAREQLEEKNSNNAAGTAVPADAERKLRKAEEESRRLKKRVDELEEELEAAVEIAEKKSKLAAKRNPSSNHDASLWARYTAITQWELWEIMLLFFGLLLAFALGGYVVDWEVRRRHGGFRV